MKKRLRVLTLTALVLLCVAVPLASQAVTASQITSYLGDMRDEPTEYGSISISPSSTVADVLDWMDDFMSHRSEYALACATDLAELIAAVDQDGDSSTVVLAADRSGALDLLRQASDLNAQLEYYYDKLFYCYNQCSGNLAEIRGGLIDASMQDEYADEAVMIMNDTEPLRKEAIAYILGTGATGWQPCADALIAALSPDGSNAAMIAGIRSVGFDVLHKQAGKLEAQDQTVLNAAPGKADPPIIKVISDKEVAFAVKLEGTTARSDLKDIPVWVRPYDSKHPNDGEWKRLVTDETGSVSIPIVDLKPVDGSVCVEVMYNAGETAVVMDGKGYPKGVERSKSKWQRREAGILNMKGGDFHCMYLAQASDSPYIVRATFNGKDMLTTESGMWLTEANDMLHTVALKLFTGNDWHRLAMWQYTTWPAWRNQILTRFEKGSDTVQTFTEKFCQQSNAKGFLDDRTLYFQIDPLVSSDSAMTAPQVAAAQGSSFETKKAEQDDKDGDSGKKKTGIDGKVELTIPGNWPIIGGSKLKVPMDGPFEIKWEVGKSIKIAFNYPVKPKALTWKSEDKKAQAERLKQEAKQNAGATALSKQGISNALSAHKKEKFLASSTASVTPYVYIMANYDVKKGVYTGHTNVGVILGYNYEFTKQFFVGPIPAFLGLEFDFKLTLGLGLGATVYLNPHNEQFKGIDFSKGSGFNFNPHIELALTVGAGLPKLAYVALRGTGWIDIDVVLGKGDDPKVELGLKAEITVGVVFWSKTWKLWEYKYPTSSLQNYMALSAASGAGGVIGLDGANALAGNFTQRSSKLPGENATETVVIQEMPCNGADIKYAYVRLGSSSNYANLAFWLGTVKVNGADKSRVLYKNLDDSSEIKELPTCGIDSAYQEYNVLEFDIDYMKSYLGICFTMQKAAKSEYNPDITDTDFFNAMLGNQDNIVLCARVYTVWANCSISALEGEYSTSFDGKRPAFTPRARFLRGNIQKGSHANLDRLNFAYAGIHLDVDQYEITGKTLMLGNYYYRVQSYVAHNYRWPDIVLLDTVYKQSDPTPVMMMFAQRKSDPTKTDMDINQLMNNPFTSVVNCNMLIPVRERKSDDTYQVNAVMCLRAENNKDMPEEQLKNSLSMIYFDASRSTEMTWDQLKSFVKSVVIRDMGVTVSADGLNSVNVRVNNQDQIYVYWIQGMTDQKVSGKNDYTEKYVVKACLVDTTLKACTRSFTWATLQKKGMKLTLLPVSDITKEKMHGYYLHADNASASGQFDIRYGLNKIEFPVTAGANLLAFSTEYPVVCQGRDFSMFFRFQSTGSLVIRGALINVLAKPCKGTGDIHLKGIRVNMDKGEQDQNEVTQYDLPDSLGNPSVLKGKYSVYPIYDVMDAYAGSDAPYTDTTFNNNDLKPETKSGENHLLGLMPGAITTFKTNVTNTPTSWKDNYELYAQIDQLIFSMGVNANDTLFTATRNSDDTFTITYQDENGVTQTLPDDGLFAYYAQPVALISDNDNLSGTGNLAADDDALYLTSGGVQTGDRVYADMRYNDLELNADKLLIGGEEYVLITLANDAVKDDGATVAGVEPMVSALADGKIIKQIKLASELDGGFRRTLLMPLKDLTGGKAYEELQLIVTAGNVSDAVIESDDASLHAKAYGEVNLYANSDTLSARSGFNVFGPSDQTIYEDESVSFSVSVSGPSAKYTFQWYVTMPDGTVQAIVGANADAYAMTKVPLARSGLTYWCEVSDGQTVVTSDRALLTVLKKPPVTGDSFPLAAALALLLVSAGGGLWALRRRRGRTE